MNTGKLGEEIAVRFLIKRGFVVLEQNFKKLPIGEVDIIAKKSGVVHFVEVKSAERKFSHETFSHETFSHETWRPEERVDETKIRKIAMVGEIYLSYTGNTDWQIDVISVLIDRENKKAKCEMTENANL
ncbi:MAG: YraN family protein [Patescibacteria group bacterium]